MQSRCTRSVDDVAAAKDPWGGTRIGVLATTKINRKEFGLTWNAALEISITLEL
jgi:polyisoprenoid-binding protein YceI